MLILYIQAMTNVRINYTNVDAYKQVVSGEIDYMNTYSDVK